MLNSAGFNKYVAINTLTQVCCMSQARKEEEQFNDTRNIILAYTMDVLEITTIWVNIMFNTNSVI